MKVRTIWNTSTSGLDEQINDDVSLTALIMYEDMEIYGDLGDLWRFMEI